MPVENHTSSQQPGFSKSIWRVAAQFVALSVSGARKSSCKGSHAVSPSADATSTKPASAAAHNPEMPFG